MHCPYWFDYVDILRNLCRSFLLFIGDWARRLHPSLFRFCYKEVSARISRQRPVLRVSSELALVGIIGEDKKSGGEWIIKVTKELVREIRL
jgi:hypothetical protein